MNSESFYRSSAWRNIRWAILKRDGFRCRGCRTRAYETGGLHIHHILDLLRWTELALADANLICLCQECHESVHAVLRSGVLQRIIATSMNNDDYGPRATDNVNIPLQYGLWADAKAANDDYIDIEAEQSQEIVG